MRYPIAIESGDSGHAYGVVVPDLPGCFSAGDTLDEAMDNAKEAIELHLEDIAERGEAIPEPGTVEAHARSVEYAGWTWALVEVADSAVKDKAIRINITMYERLLERVDLAAKVLGDTRSGFIAKATATLIESTFSQQPAKATKPGIPGGNRYRGKAGIYVPESIRSLMGEVESEKPEPKVARKRVA